MHEKPLLGDEESFGRFIRNLPDEEKCPFMAGLDLDLCSDLRFECPFRGEDTYSLRSGMTKECKRPRILKLRKILGR